MTFRLQARHRLEWAILVPVDAVRLELLVRSLDVGVYVLDPEDEEDGELHTWHVVAGSGEYAAVIETAPGSSGAEIELATELARAVGATVYAVGFVGYDDPDHGIPSIVGCDGETQRLIWMAETFDDELPDVELSPGPAGVPADDPFGFTEALGFRLRHLY